MKFIDENSLNRLNFKELLSRVDIFSAYGKNKLNNVTKFFSRGRRKIRRGIWENAKNTWFHFCK